METVKVTKVFVSDKNKEGIPFKTKTGKPFWKVGIGIDGKEGWWSSLAFAEDDAVMKIKEGSYITVILKEEGQFKNFSIPSRLDLLEARLTAIEDSLKPNGPLETKKKDLKPGEVDRGYEYPEADDGEIPF